MRSIFRQCVNRGRSSRFALFAMAQARNWCFTIHDPASIWEEDPRERYVVWQLESCPETGRKHLQGYVEFNKQLRLAALKKLHPTAHWEARRGTRDQARAYCMKEETRLEGPYERGTWETQQGKRTDLEGAVAALREGGMKRVVEEHPTVFVKFHKGLRELERAIAPRPTDADFVPRPWQKRVLDLLAVPATDREILWIVDTQGAKGKSRLARHLVLEHGAALLSGRVQDMAYMYNKERIAIFDITRTQAENLNHLYSFAESLKNGTVVSTKYESVTKVFDTPHVIFFANVMPSSEAWSADRYKVLDLSCPDMHV